MKNLPKFAVWLVVCATAALAGCQESYHEKDERFVLIAANIVHGLSAAHNIALLNKARAQVATGARLLLVDLWMDPSHTQPPAVGTCAIPVLAICSGLRTATS